MNIISLPISHSTFQYVFDPVTGLLLEKEMKLKKISQQVPNKKLEKAIHSCNKPYLLRKGVFKNDDFINDIFIKFYVFALIKTCKVSFLLGKIAANFGRPIFDSSQEAIDYFRKLYPGGIQNDLCYPRSLFAASTSKKFAKEGVMFIGIFLPSKSMHAWIIEDGIQPDCYDNMWINFQPVAAIY
ncbi:hypothetical protein [Flavobacterium ovatum]|uniref:hypothetical protein n=1 Tax=Flavobacterium ovatum TaxID=1928857 RepID=UPI00344E228D